LDWFAGVQHCQRFEIAIVGLLRNLAAGIQIADSLAHGQVLLGALGVSLRAPVDAKGTVVVHRAFRAKNGAGLVVDFDGIRAGFMFDADPFRTVSVTGRDIRGVVRIPPFTEEAQYVSTAEGADRSANELRIDTSQGRRVSERHIGCPLGLVTAPVVV